MEGVPSMPMISFPLKRSAGVPDFKSEIKRLIAQEYKEDSEAYNEEIANLESLRAAATHVSRDLTGCATLKNYFCQLNFLKSRFPFREGGCATLTKYFCQLNFLKSRFSLREGSQIATSFSWYDVYSDSAHGRKDIDFEMACILYNIGALYSKLASKEPSVSADGMNVNASCTHFQCAAWIFEHLQNEWRNKFSPDLSPDLLRIMTNICLAQAQERILTMSLVDNGKPMAITRAKVSAQIVEYYQQPLNTIDQLLEKSSGGHSEEVLQAIKKWKDLVETKAHYYSCLTYLYRGLHSEEQLRFGERITFLKAGAEQLNEAIKCAKNMDKSDARLVAKTLNFTADVIGTKLATSHKANELWHHEKVPELEAVDAEFKGVSFVKGIPFNFEDLKVSGPDIFSRLVPVEVREASSLYSEEKAKLLLRYSTKVEEKNASLESFLLDKQFWPLLGPHRDGNSHTVQQQLLDCCASLRAHPEAVKRLSSLMSKLSSLFHNVEHSLNKINELLKADEAGEKEFQEIVGKRPPNSVITELSREVEKYQQAHSVASESNQTLHEAMRIHVVNLQILMEPLPELLKSIPSISEAEFNDEVAGNEVKRLRSKIEKMKKEREMLKNRLRDSILNDDITKILMVKQDQDLGNVLQEELKKHEKITNLLDQNLLAQNNILRAVTEANAAYAGTRKATKEVMEKRNQVIQDLLRSYDAYNELLIRCVEGVEFYTKLDTIVSDLLQRVRSICKVSAEELVLGIPLVLEKIFSSIPTKMLLRSCSLVNKFWNTEARTFIRNHRRCTPRTDSFTLKGVLLPASGSCLLACEFLPRLEQLCRQIEENGRVVPFNCLYAEFGYKCPDDSMINGMNWENLATVLQIKHFVADSKCSDCDLHQPLLTLLRHMSSELQSLEMNSLYALEHRLQGIPDWVPNFRKLEKLRISGRLWEEDISDEELPESERKEILSWLLKDAPNLEKIIAKDLQSLSLLPENVMRFVKLEDKFEIRLRHRQDLSLLLSVSTEGFAVNHLWIYEPPSNVEHTRGDLVEDEILDVNLRQQFDCAVKQRILQSGRDTLKSIDIIGAYPLAHLCQPEEEEKDPHTVLSNLLALHIQKRFDGKLEELWNAIASTDYGKIMPRLNCVRITIDAQVEAGEDFYEDFWNEWPTANIDDSLRSRCSTTVRRLHLSVYIQKVNLLPFTVLFPNVSTLELFFFPEARLEAVVDIWQWPEIEEIKITFFEWSPGGNFDAEFCGINEEEAELLREQDEDYLRSVHIVPIKPCALTMSKLRVLHLSNPGNFINLEISKVIELIVLRRMSSARP